MRWQWVFKEVRLGDCTEYQGGSRLFKQFSHLDIIGPPWKPLLFLLLVGVKHASLTTVESTLLQLNYTAYLHLSHFTLRPLDLIGPINPSSWGHIWILTATECCTKWVERVALKGVNRVAVANFIWDNAGVAILIFLMRLLSDNKNPFVNIHLRKLLEYYGIDQLKSSL